MSMACTIELPSGPADVPREFGPGSADLVYGQGVPYVFEWLEDVARAVGVVPLSHFLADEDVPDEPSWFPPEAALESVRGLLRYVSSSAPDPIVVQGAAVSREDLSWDLRVYESILFRVASSGERFRFIAG